MSSGAVSGMGAFSNINQSVTRIGNVNKAAVSQSINTLKTVDAKISSATKEVINVAVENKADMVKVIGNTIDVIA